MRRFFKPLIWALVGALFFTSCTSAATLESGEETSPTSLTAASASSETEQEHLKAYFENLGSNDPRIAVESIELAAPGSNAEAYAIYLTAIHQADTDAGYAIVKDNVNSVENGFVSCSFGDMSEDGCAEYTDIRLEGNQISDFKTGEKALDGRLDLGDGSTTSVGELAEVELIATYESITGIVLAVFDIHSVIDDIFVSGHYQAPDGRHSEPTLISGPSELAEGAYGTFAFHFEGAEYGGEITLQAYSVGGYNTAEATFAIK